MWTSLSSRLFAGEVMVDTTRGPEDEPDGVACRPPRPPEACGVHRVAPHRREHPAECWLRLQGQCRHMTVSVTI